MRQPCNRLNTKRSGISSERQQAAIKRTRMARPAFFLTLWRHRGTKGRLCHGDRVTPPKCDPKRQLDRRRFVPRRPCRSGTQSGECQMPSSRFRSSVVTLLASAGWAFGALPKVLFCSFFAHCFDGGTMDPFDPFVRGYCPCRPVSANGPRSAAWAAK